MSDSSSIALRSGAGRLFQAEILLDLPLQPEAVLPVQFYPPKVPCDDMAAIQRLMLAILDDALRRFEKNLVPLTLRGRREYQEVEHWLFKGKDAENVFSFENVCEAVGIEPNCLRTAILEWQSKALSGESPHRLSRRSPVLLNARPRIPSCNLARRMRRASSIREKPGHLPSVG
jgi:hypothetical protein